LRKSQRFEQSVKRRLKTVLDIRKTTR